ncbi:MAG: PQQ-binding-like beta-propeller repeat protein [Gemmataceae bacterium]
MPDAYGQAKIRPGLANDVTRCVSVKYEANKLLGALPAEGLAVYDLFSGEKAFRLLRDAKKTGDIDKLATVARRYYHTSSGPEANDLLATYFLDRGQYFMAALRFDKLLKLPPRRTRITDLTLFKAALAYQRAGDNVNRARAEKVLAKLLPRLAKTKGLRVGDRLIPVKDLQEYMTQTVTRTSFARSEWPFIRGDKTNTGQAAGGPPLLDKTIFVKKTILQPHIITGEPEFSNRSKEWVLKSGSRSATQRYRTTGRPVMPGFFPIAVDGKIIYRTYTGLTAVSVNDYVLDDGTPIKAGELEWKSTEFDGSLASLMEKTYSTDVEGWLSSYSNQPTWLNLVFENSLVGTLSCDQQRVYAVDDLAVPVPPNVAQNLLQNSQFNRGNPFSPKLRKLVMGNSLRAFDTTSGKIVWCKGLDDNTAGKETNPFDSSFFLGPPLPIGGRLYALNEKAKNGELSLVVLDPISGQVLESQTLGQVMQNSRFHVDALRRINAVHMGYGEGILVCPTNAGEVLGVDLLGKTLAWAYPYRESEKNEQPTLRPGFRPQNYPLTPAEDTWKSTPPAIVDGKVVFTAPDSDSLHCISLRDGTLDWKYRKAENDVFFAGVFDQTVLIVGKFSVQARDLDTGRFLWERPTGDLPAGQGTASGNRYYLPLDNGEIIVIDVPSARIFGHNRLRTSDQPKPANLLFYRDTVLSQTTENLVAYPPLFPALKKADLAFKKAPSNWELLARLGELQLAAGKGAEAVSNLRKVRSNTTSLSLKNRVNDQLYLAYTDLMQANFKGVTDTYLKEYEAVCKETPDETLRQKRLGKFFRLLGRGHESVGQLAKAYSAYTKLEGLSLFESQGVPALENPKNRTPLSLWMKAQVLAMIDRATAKQQQELEAVVNAQWEKVAKSKDLDSVRRFIDKFGVPFEAGRRARLYFADAVLKDPSADGYLEAELALNQLRGRGLDRDASAGGRALETLARLAMRQGGSVSSQATEATREAAAYYRQLAERYPNAKIRGGKTGKEFLAEIVTDPRMLPALEKRSRRWDSGTLATRQVTGNYGGSSTQGFLYRPVGNTTLRTAQLRFRLQNSGRQAMLIDSSTGKSLWTHQLNLDSTSNQFYYLLQQLTSSNIRFNRLESMDYQKFHVQGHLAVMQVGHQVFAFDLQKPRLLWQVYLWDKKNTPGVTWYPQNMQIRNGRITQMLRNNYSQVRYDRLGEIVAVRPSYVCLRKTNSLVVVDPLKGQTIWSQRITSDDLEAFGDDRNIYVLNVRGKTAGGARAYRVTDGKEVPLKASFAGHYRNRLHIQDGQILSSTVEPKGQVKVQLFDIPSGKIVWSQQFAPGSNVLRTVDPKLTGIVEPEGTVTVMDAGNGKKLMVGNLFRRGRVQRAALQTLKDPLLLADEDHYYVALNQPIDDKAVQGNFLATNFLSIVHSEVVNGWFCAFHRKDGSRKIRKKTETWKTGDLAWHVFQPVKNQRVVLEQFGKLPVIVFSSRYVKPSGNLGRTTWVSRTETINRRNGKILWPESRAITSKERPSNGSARFLSFVVNTDKGEIMMTSWTDGLIHYVLEPGAKPPTRPTKKPSAKIKYDPNSPLSQDVTGPVPVRPPGQAGGRIGVRGPIAVPGGLPVPNRIVVNPRSVRRIRK